MTMSAPFGVPGASLVASVQRVGNVVRRVIGVPDYARYVAHMAAAHPEQPVLTQDEFGLERLAAKYQRPGTRCC